ncbi:hypothetical protein JYU34_002783 [Plutella xylostella]|uniref:Uncharacterized protein n=1 Tax=Plutella xylostella TaxID=51655 RepID=A0ABQ7R3A4_PLUXY|nr:hypothetical protein JYU34_002783 [Plutella xylostella]
MWNIRDKSWSETVTLQTKLICPTVRLTVRLKTFLPIHNPLPPLSYRNSLQNHRGGGVSGRAGGGGGDDVTPWVHVGRAPQTTRLGPCRLLQIAHQNTNSFCWTLRQSRRRRIKFCGGDRKFSWFGVPTDTEIKTSQINHFESEDIELPKPRHGQSTELGKTMGLATQSARVTKTVRTRGPAVTDHVTARDRGPLQLHEYRVRSTAVMQSEDLRGLTIPYTLITTLCKHFENKINMKANTSLLNTRVSLDQAPAVVHSLALEITTDNWRDKSFVVGYAARGGGEDTNLTLDALAVFSDSRERIAKANFVVINASTFPPQLLLAFHTRCERRIREAAINAMQWMLDDFCLLDNL